MLINVIVNNNIYTFTEILLLCVFVCVEIKKFMFVLFGVLAPLRPACPMDNFIKWTESGPNYRIPKSFKYWYFYI